MGKYETERERKPEGDDNLTVLTIILSIALIGSLVKQFLYRSALIGVLYYVLDKHKIELSEEKVKELQIYAGTRLVKEFFHLK